MFLKRCLLPVIITNQLGAELDESYLQAIIFPTEEKQLSTDIVSCPYSRPSQFPSRRHEQLSSDHPRSVSCLPAAESVIFVHQLVSGLQI